MVASPLVKGSRFGADLSRSLSNRGRELLEAEDLAQRVEALEPLEAYFIVKELGIEEALPILHHCSEELLQTFVDLDCWDGDVPDAGDIDAWLAPFAAEGAEALATAFLALDEELQVWFLGQSIEVFPIEADDLLDLPDGVVPWRTPDAFYLILNKAGDGREVPPAALIESLYAHDVNLGFRLVTAAQWETPNLLEELANHFRSARLEGLGFPTREVALNLFAPPAAGERVPFSLPRSGCAPNLPALYAAPLAEASLLARALAELTDTDLLSQLEQDLRHLINHAIIAYGDSPRDVGHAAAVAGRVRDTVSLGLEALLSPEIPLSAPESAAHTKAAADLLSRWSLFDLFRQGHLQVRRVQAQASALAEDPAVEQWRGQPLAEKDDYGDERLLRELLNGLLEKPPLYSGFDRVRPAARRAFASQQELREALARLDEIEARSRTFRPG